MMVSGAIRASWQVLMSPSARGSGGQAGMISPSCVLNVKPVAVAVMT